MSDKAFPVPPVVFNTPTLGRAACLGELYDLRSGKFLGVQLYPQDKVKEVETNIRHTELTVSLSTTLQQKATVIDINAQLSLDVLGGLVEVSGSASYLNDEKSNTNEYAYALALKMRLKEKRILFAEPELGRKVLDIVEKDYINTKLATHFVSSITYGSNYIVNLVARQTEITKEERIEGKLQASLDKLKGAICLEGSVDAEMKEEFKDMDVKFDLVVHGDVALGKVPVTPKDVLETFPEAASLVTDGGGVPISATLQPIPPDLYKGGLIYQIEDDLANTVLAAFSDLDDLHSRFLVLQDSVKRLQDFIPELAKTTRAVSTAYIREHSKLLHELGKFLQEYKLGKAPDHEDLLYKADRLYNKHLGLDDEKKKCSDEAAEENKPNTKDVSKNQYPSILVKLEDQLSRFRHLVTDIRTVRQSLTPKDKKSDVVDRSFYLSSLEDVCKAIRTQSETPFFIMVPISSVRNHDLVVLKYIAMVRKYSEKFKDIVNTAHMFYAESLQNLEDRLPNNNEFAKLKAPSLYIGKVNENGDLSWVFSPPLLVPTPSQSYALAHKPSGNAFGHLSLAIRGVNGKEAYTILFWAKEENPASNLPKPDAYMILLLENTTNDSVYLAFRNGFGVKGEGGGVQLGFKNKRPGKGETFIGAFVQDTEVKQWILYLNGDEIDRKAYNKANLADNLQIGYPRSEQWWSGEVSDFKAYSRALSKEQIKRLCSG